MSPSSPMRLSAGLSPRLLALVQAVALSLLFEEYDTGILNAALRQIVAELRVPEERLALDLAIIRLGALPAFVFVPLADRYGRRPLFLISTTAMGVLTFATAFSQSLTQFVIFQALVRTFALAGSAIAFVIVSEELPADRRGVGLGVLAAVGATGHGLGAALYSQIDVLPFGWRFLYAMGVVPVLLLPYFLARVTETGRFVRMREEAAPRQARGLVAEAFLPLISLFVAHPARALGVSIAGACAAMAIFPTFQFASYFVQEQHGWSPGRYSLMVIVGGGVGIVGNVVAGRLGDGVGRKRVGFVMLALCPAFVYGLYNAQGTALIGLSWVGCVFFSMGGRLILRALSTELFSTSERGAASGLFSVLETVGGVVGLLATHAIGTQDTHTIALAAPLVSMAMLLAAITILLFPETGRRELEEIS